MSQEKFACATDAIKALSKLSKNFKYHQVKNYEIFENAPEYQNKTQSTSYQILGNISNNQSIINTEILSSGRFIIATNILDESGLSNNSMIFEYKAQQSCERGFGFLKDPLFFTDSIFLKSPEKIESLAMIMGLCLLVYTLAQRQIRDTLSSLKSTIKNQLGKYTARPTLRWIFQCFQSIHLVISEQKKQVSNWNIDRDFLLTLLPVDCHSYYKFVT